MIPVFPIGEFFDRLAISQVKWEKIQNNKEELDWYTNQVDEKLLDSIMINLKISKIYTVKFGNLNLH